MKKRKIILAVTLLCAAASIYFLVIHIRMPQEDIPLKQEPARNHDGGKTIMSSPGIPRIEKNERSPDRKNQTLKRRPAQKEYLRTIVYYFHYSSRDAVCKNIERLTSHALYAYFGNQLASGKLVWKSVNVEDPGNRHFIDDYDLKRRAIIIVTPAADRQIRWKALESAESLAGDKARYMSYIRGEVLPHLREQ